MKKLPIVLNIDDGCAICHPYYQHTTNKDKVTNGDGHPLVKTIPLSFSYKFCDLMEKYGAKGKLSIIPLPGGENPYETSEGKEWLNLITSKLTGKFSFCPEMLTHYLAYDIKNERYTEDYEYVWAGKQNKESLREYIELALTKLKDLGVLVSGVTSPWNFGEPVVDDYRNAISEAYFNVFGKTETWYFLDCKEGEGRPEIVLDKDGRRLVSIPATTQDFIWACTEWNRTDEEFILSRAEKYISKDGKSGQIIETINNGGIPCILTHWPSLFSNGRETGLKVLEIVFQRVQDFLGDKYEFVSFDELTKMCLNGEI